jgi:phosphate transport system permease protein
LTFFISLVSVPLMFVLFMACWQVLRRLDWVRRVENGYEFLVVLPVLLLGVAIAIWLTSPIETWLFRGTQRRILLILVSGSVVLPVTLLAFGAIRRYLMGPAEINCIGHGRERLRRLGTIIWWTGAVVLGCIIALWLGAYLEALLFPAGFSGPFRQWLYRGPLNAQYDQRNCIIIAFGLGFTVIPIIFSIAEDSLSNVPYNMTAASMAVGASRWQTLWRVVLPSASPGIFAAMMIGFGRAVGETMIVLMATGNTPILSGSPFNGMRTLSANIAVEIPEAPVGGTLYRVLFLCAVLLFGLTFTVNTAAEMVRQRLRKRFGRF